MKTPLLIGVSALALLTLGATLFAQTTTGSSLITEMKAGLRDFTLAGQLNPGITGLQSAPVGGKKTGDMLTAGEYNRILELVGQGGGGGATGVGSAFRVRLANNYNSTENVPLVVHWDTEDFDEGNKFDMTSHSYKPTTAGYYFLSATVCYEDLNSANGTGSDQVAVFISKNGSASLTDIGANLFQGTNIVTYSGLTDPCVLASGVVYSDGDDYFSVRAWQDDINPTPIKAGSVFSGFQINGGTGGGSGGGGGLGYGQTWQNMKGSAVGCAGPRISGTICTNNTGKPIQVNVSAAATEGQNVITFYCYAGTGTDVFLGLAQRFWNGMGDSVGSVSFVVPVGGVYHCDMASNLPSTVTWSHWVELR